jgi:hypothetical protein
LRRKFALPRISGRIVFAVKVPELIAWYEPSDSWETPPLRVKVELVWLATGSQAIKIRGSRRTAIRWAEIIPWV